MITDKEIKEKYRKLPLEEFIQWSIDQEISIKKIKTIVTKVEIVKTLKTILICVGVVILVLICCNWMVQK